MDSFIKTRLNSAFILFANVSNSSITLVSVETVYNASSRKFSSARFNNFSETSVCDLYSIAMFIFAKNSLYKTSFNPEYGKVSRMSLVICFVPVSFFIKDDAKYTTSAINITANIL